MYQPTTRTLMVTCLNPDCTQSELVTVKEGNALPTRCSHCGYKLVSYSDPYMEYGVTKKVG